MNAPFHLPTEAARFPKLSPAQKLLQAAADSAIFREIIAEMNLKPGISGPASTPERLSFKAWRC
jgi:hypothetical protein